MPEITVASTTDQQQSIDEAAGIIEKSNHNPPRCECHNCTQARYRESLQWQFDQMRIRVPSPSIETSPENPYDCAGAFNKALSSLNKEVK